MYAERKRACALIAENYKFSWWSIVSTRLHCYVPYLTASAIEADAQSLLDDFSGKFYQLTKPPIPVDEIAELHLQLILEFKDMKEIFPFADIYGAIWFDTSLIGIDTSLDPSINPLMLGRYRFTLPHEIGHWRLGHASNET